MQNELAGTHEHIEDEAFILVKAAPRASQKYGETVCIAAVDRDAKWRRLYPVSFRYMEHEQRFARWDKIRYRWRRPRTSLDRRPESCRVDDKSIEIVGSLAARERHSLVNRLAVNSLKKERVEGRSLAMLKCEILEFKPVRRTAAEMEKQRATYAQLRSQEDMLASVRDMIPREPCPFAFKYHFKDDDGPHWGTCQDWETEATFMRRLHEMTSEQQALDWMCTRFGEEWPRLGMGLAMGTNRRRPEQWLINGVIRYDETPQALLL
jgi:hypothetical protein